MTSITHFLLMLSFTSINRSERWYSATVIETDKPLRPKEQKEFRIIHTQGNEEKFLPIDLRYTDYRFSTEETNRWHFINRKFNKNDSTNDSLYDKAVLEQQNTTNAYTRVQSKNMRKICSRKGLRSNQNKKRFLEVFQVVKFDNVPCTSSSGLEGTCLHEYECQSSEGTGMGTCADGYGTCCVTLLPCDSESSAAVGWFTNPDYPMPSNNRLSCAVALSKASEEVTQIRLDFVTFELLPPTAGICQEDQFIVSGQNVNNVIPILCGINTGQHVYVEVGESEGPIYLSIQTASPENRLFSIKVTQLTSSDDLTAPPGCIQYFTETKGYLESFNYRDKSDISIARTSSYLNNLNYAMCIERVPGSCSVTYTNAGYLQIVNYDTVAAQNSREQSEHIGQIIKTGMYTRVLRGVDNKSSSIDSLHYAGLQYRSILQARWSDDGLPVIPPGQAGVEIFNCPSDWLLISATRLCGDRLNDGSILQDFSMNAPITDYSAGPIVVWFRSDEGYVGRGFKIQYVQNSCLLHKT